MAQTESVQKATAISGGEFAFRWSDFRRLAAIVQSESGIVLGDNKANMVYSRLAKRLRKIGLSSFRDYCRLIESEQGADERRAMIAAMTTNVTHFFREPHHFDHLRTEVLPRLAAAARKGGRVRLWSAGCSSGEEPYSIALTLLDAMPDAAERDVLVLATDIDYAELARAEQGLYTARAVEGIPQPLRANWLVPTGEPGEAAFQIAGSVRRIVRFRELNLLDTWPMRGRFQAVFCRNVMIYFDDATQNEIWSRFAQVIEPGGFFYIGHSERIAAAGLPFELVGRTTYRRRAEATP